MQPHSPPPPFRRPTAMHAAESTAGGPRPAERNEFTDAVARMFEHRQRLAPDFAPTLRDDARLHDDGDDWETSRVALLKTRLKSLFGASALRRALAIVPLAILGYAIAWLVYFKPPQIVTAKSAGEAKPEVTRAAAPIEPPPPEVADARPAPTQM